MSSKVMNALKRKGVMEKRYLYELKAEWSKLPWNKRNDYIKDYYGKAFFKKKVA